MNAPNQTRVPAGVTTGGQFSTSARSEADVILARDAKLDLPDGTEVAFRNTLSGTPKWMHGVITRDAPLSAGQLGVTVGEGEQTNTHILDAGSLLPFVEPSEYDGDDSDTMAEAFNWSSDDWGYYYDGVAERDQTSAYETGRAEGAASVTELAHPAGAGTVQVWTGEDGVPVFQIDTTGDYSGPVRINLNDGTPVYQGDPETQERNANEVLGSTVADLRALLASDKTNDQKLSQIAVMLYDLRKAGWDRTD